MPSQDVIQHQQSIALGRYQLFKKLQNVNLAQIAKLFYEDDKLPEDMGYATIRFFELLQSSPGDDPHQIRKRKYEEMVMSNRSKKSKNPSLLPPSPRAAHFHGLRVYHQLRVWIGLHKMDLEPCKWGWKMIVSPLS